ncbi:hypothetical protein ACILG0_04175 [Pseudomonadota bacterium AL_CKDN230030165-1A_HGKHYDSX7]
MTMPFSAQQLNKILADIRAGKFKGYGPSKPEVVSDGKDGTLVSIPISNNEKNVLYRQLPDGIWEIEGDSPPAQDPLDHFAVQGVREAGIEVRRRAAAAAQSKFPSDELYRIRHLIYAAWEDAIAGQQVVTAELLLKLYERLRGHPG